MILGYFVYNTHLLIPKANTLRRYNVTVLEFSKESIKIKLYKIKKYQSYYYRQFQYAVHRSWRVVADQQYKNIIISTKYIARSQLIKN